jgi:hypothetical protein
MGVSYSKRALLKDYERIKEAEEILNQQDWNQAKPRPHPDINRDGQLFFVTHEQPSNRVMQGLMKAGWSCMEVNHMNGTVFHYTHPRTFNPSYWMNLVSLLVLFCALVSAVVAVFSLEVLFKMKGLVWFEPGSLYSKVN